MVELLVLIAALPILLVGARFVRALQRSQQLPANNPRWYLSARKPERARVPDGKTTVVCVGDSVTHGRMSADYVARLGARLDPGAFEVVNAGVNKELAYNVLARMDEIVACEPDVVTVMIGTNDANASVLPENAERAMGRMGLPVAPSPAWFRENLVRIVETLQERTRARIALLSIPPIGEDLEHPAALRAAEHSRIIEAVAREKGVASLPVFEQIRDRLAQDPGRPRHRYDRWRRVVYVAFLRRHVLGQDFDTISAANGFRLLTDFIHLNHRGAEIAAGLVQEFLEEGEGTTSEARRRHHGGIRA